MEIGKEDLNTNVFNINIRQLRIFVYIQPDISNQFKTRYFIRNCKWNEEKCPPDILKNNCLQAKNLDEIISSLCAERGTVCGNKMKSGTSVKDKGTQLS